MAPCHPFHDARLAWIFVPLAFSSCQSCGEVRLAGDSVEPDLPVSICGNGVIEPGEECDGGRRICEGEAGCGSGTQECNAECTWGDCVAAEFEVIAGPILASGDYVVQDNTGNVLWQDGRFTAFYLCRDELAGLNDQNGCLSTIDADGGLYGPPSIFAPFSIFDVPLWNVTVVNASGSLPFAVIFDTASTGPAIFNFIDAEPLSETYGEDFRTMVKLVRLDGEGGFIGEPLDIYGESYSHTVRVAWSGSRYGVTWNVPLLDPSNQSRMHFALLGCVDPD